MKLSTTSTGFFAVLLLFSSCEYYSEVYTNNESISTSVYKGYDGDNYEIVNGEYQPVMVDYVQNGLSFDIVNSGNLPAYDIEIEVSVFTDKFNELYESINLDMLNGKETQRLNVDRILVDEYFVDYTINVYWYSDE